MFTGLLVDLVPYGRRFFAREHDWMNNESRYWGSMGDRVLHTQATLEREQREWLDDPGPTTSVSFGLQAKDGTPLGYLGINYQDLCSRTACLGAVIAEPSYWGGGYGTDALFLLMEYCFDALDLRRVWLETVETNVRVVRQMAKVGLNQTFRQN